ncbi:MAG TPA: DEAD/DEAH box helicase, partial [Nitrospira sp.]|nr:DEAD/DEAH box helicase [Nitrospira sp.]
LVVHAPFGGRINRAWGLALRKRFCVMFDFELQAAATDNGLVVSLGEKHSFPLESVFGYLHSHSVQDVLTQAVLLAPMFATRWRWNASRSLALLRFSRGKKVPPQIQRMKAEDLLAAVFPDAMACQENLTGERVARQIPDHPLVTETLRDCLTEAMDLDGFTRLLSRIEAGAISCLAMDTPVPSPFSHEILNANPYAFLDDAPLEERRARAVEMRRTLPAELAGQVGALNLDAIEEVQRECWPIVRNPDDLHDALLMLVWLPESAVGDWETFFPSLVDSGRAGHFTPHPSRFDTLTVPSHAEGPLAPYGASGWVATENRERIEGLFAGGDDVALDSIVQGWMESIGPTTVRELADRLHLSAEQVDRAMIRLEASGQVLRGQFRRASLHPSPLPPHGIDWCHRRLLARIHRLTIGALRREVEPVTAAEFMRFLLQWQHVAPGSRQHGEAGLLEVVRQLTGFEAAASAWESQILRPRLDKYEPELLDRLCLSGAVGWGRLSPHPRLLQSGEAERRRIIPTSVAPISLFLREEIGWLLAVHDGTGSAESGPSVHLSPVAQDLSRVLHESGASFFADLVRVTSHLPAEVEDALWELVAAGLVTADGFDNLRALIDPHRRRAEGRERSRRPRHSAGRWALMRPERSSTIEGHSLSHSSSRSHLSTSCLPPYSSLSIEPIARQMLRRYGVVFRDLLARESLVPSWRDLLVQYRRMEMAGEVRGGRFITGFPGEQFALPEAVESLRAMRRGSTGTASSQEVRISASDPLNLVGVILPGARVPAVPANYLVFRDGVPVRSGMVRESGITDRQATGQSGQVPAG